MVVVLQITVHAAMGLACQQGADGDNQPAQLSSGRRLPLHPQSKLLHHFHHGLEPLPIGRQLVLHLDRRRGVDGALDQARFLQRAKVQGEGALGDAGHVAAQVVEAAGGGGGGGGGGQREEEGGGGGKGKWRWA